MSSHFYILYVISYFLHVIYMYAVFFYYPKANLLGTETLSDSDSKESTDLFTSYSVAL